MQHYALSELLIVLAGMWAARACLGHHHKAAALGIFLFTMAAALGAVRFGLDRDGSLIAVLADIHRLAGTLGGTAAMMALVYDLLARRAGTANWARSPWRRRYMVLAVSALALAAAFAPLIVPFFALWSLIFIMVATRQAALFQLPSAQVFVLSAFMLVNVLVFRQAAWLSPSVSWHIFHVLTALWLVGLGYLLARPVLAGATGAAARN